MERDITNKEYKEATSLYKSLYPTEYRFWIVILGVISIVLFMILFSISYLVENKSLLQSIVFALYGPGFITVIVICNYFLNFKRCGSEKVKFKLDLIEGKIKIKSISVKEAWKIFDPGYNRRDKPDILFKTMDEKWICIPYDKIKHELENFRSQINLVKLKRSNFVVGVNFSGDTIISHEKMIEAQNEWRNDDLQYFETFNFDNFSDNLKKQISTGTCYNG